jgi:predicted DNA-binding transcriptional regulator AlpA
MGARLAGPYVGLSATSLRRLASIGKAPKPIAIEGRRVWRRADLDAWIAGQAAGVPTSDEELLRNG